jgi:F0F1-type ATP synthase membrane subunit a
VIRRWLLLLATLTGTGRLLGTSVASEEHGLPPQAVDIARPFGLPITNSTVVTWIVALGLIIFAWVATRNMKAVPDGAQNFLEWLVGGLYSFLEGIIGPHLVKRTFWFFATIFIFILSANWFGLIPWAGTIGWGREYIRRRKHVGYHVTDDSPLGLVLPVPSYFLELLVGFVQALVFMLSTAVFNAIDLSARGKPTTVEPETET